MGCLCSNPLLCPAADPHPDTPRQPFLPGLGPMQRKIDPLRLMVQWYVHAVIPTYPEVGAYNETERYDWDAARRRFTVTFEFNSGSFDGPLRAVPQVGWFDADDSFGTLWRVSPTLCGCALPVKFPYYILDVPDDYSHMIVGSNVGSSSYLWIMTRAPRVEPARLEAMIDTACTFGFLRDAIRKREHDRPVPALE
ncbi:hypothetical protein EMIHUDRAFT_95606 [Emiliania huxleyi CCMP1516]|uniref:Lipocalin/cytosolic fatty-acid binding domain-containing protein n=3 Tax=Emiliania huxleyi TaxID=2903 RepID=A0A0D3JHM3_EMIH1|nr:hypothetical protein EMIHUDRAFT_95606 [Emiliania huxleyi CCMP1516]EOD23008.1 hypothetical protein EMIHUDRAFT_95606 [Emiliania huxleyi CCMP1516]|eukprot:XP_005775437.1 hypothetical protein EMIHUDRAFT_95606 [Emiliania huxleyi CCMP1516]